MTDRNKKSSSREKASANTQRQSTFFISGEGIDREVITTDICRYLGNDALVKPGTHHDKSTGRVQEGFYITAYRPPTTAQLADLRADSQKWREERRISARAQGGYDQSATQQEAMRRGNLDESRSPSGGYPPTTYGGMAPSINPTMATRPPDFSTRVAYPTANPAMQAQVQPGTYRNTGGYQPSEQNYTYSAQPPQQNYSVMESNRDRMDTTTGQPNWNMPPSSSYPSGAAPIASNYAPARPTYSYAPVGGNPSVPAGYGRAEPQGYDPYGPRDTGVPQPEPQEDYYGNEEAMDYEEPPAPAQAPAQAQPRRERESQDRHQEPRQKRSGHR